MYILDTNIARISAMKMLRTVRIEWYQTT